MDSAILVMINVKKFYGKSITSYKCIKYKMLWDTVPTTP